MCCFVSVLPTLQKSCHNLPCVLFFCVLLASRQFRARSAILPPSLSELVIRALKEFLLDCSSRCCVVVVVVPSVLHVHATASCCTCVCVCSMPCSQFLCRVSGWLAGISARFLRSPRRGETAGFQIDNTHVFIIDVPLDVTRLTIQIAAATEETVSQAAAAFLESTQKSSAA